MPTSASAAASSGSQTVLSALGDYHTYLADSLANLTAAQKQASSVVASVEHNCPEQLAQLNDVPATRKVKSAVTAFGHEIDADLSLAWLDGTVKPALANLATALGGLQWATPAQAQTTTRLISADKTLLGLHQSNLCDDATELTGDPQDVPAATSTLLFHYDRDHSAVVSAQNAFGTLLSQGASSSGASLLAKDQSLEAQFTNSTTGTEQSDASEILSDLGFV